MKSAADFAGSNPGNFHAENGIHGHTSIAPAEDIAPEKEYETSGSGSQQSGNVAPGDAPQDSESLDNEPEIPIPPSIRFHKKGDNGNLLAVTIEPSDDFPLGIRRKTIQSWIRQQGCGSWKQDESAVSRFSRQASRLDEHREYVLAERKICSIETQVSPDRLKAWVAVDQGFGGRSFSEMSLRDALEDNQIRFGIKESVLQEITQKGWCEKTLIAEGVPPVEGEKVKFVPLVEESDHKGIPQEREDGSVDHKNLRLYMTVSEGTPLLRHFPPTEGTPGTGVDGAPIPAPPSKDRVLIPSVGAAISPDDPDVAIATRSGKPFYDDNSVRVDPTLEVNKVDPSTGNVIFDGNIVVWGPVEAGYTVQAGRDLTILDTVEGADLAAGKDITLVTGIYGRGKSRISLKGNLVARFLNDCTIECGGNIEITDLMSHCSVECEGSVHLGNFGGKGQIIGGDVHVLKKVQARIIGSISEIATRIAVGPSKGFLSKIKELKKEIARIEKDIETLSESTGSGSQDADIRPDDKGSDTKHVDPAEKIKTLEEEAKDLREKLDSSIKGIIESEEVYRGAVLSVGSTRKTIQDLTTDFSLYQDFNETY